MPRAEYHEESQSRSQRCMVCENYFTPADIAPPVHIPVIKNGASGNICFYCYNPVRCHCGDKSQDGGNNDA